MSLTFNPGVIADGLNHYRHDGRRRTRKADNPWDYKADSAGIPVQITAPPAAVVADLLAAPGDWFRRGYRGLAVRPVGATGEPAPVTLAEFAAALGSALSQLPALPDGSYAYGQARRIAAHGGRALDSYAAVVFGEYRMLHPVWEEPKRMPAPAERAPGRPAAELRRLSRERVRLAKEATAEWAILEWLEDAADDEPFMPADIYDEVLSDMTLAAAVFNDIRTVWDDERDRFGDLDRVIVPSAPLFARVARRMLEGRVSRGTRYVLPLLRDEYLEAVETAENAPVAVVTSSEPVEAVEDDVKLSSSDSEHVEATAPTPITRLSDEEGSTNEHTCYTLAATASTG